MNSRTTKVTLVAGLFATLLLASPKPSSAQTGFQRIDAYDFRGVHSFTVHGPDPDHLTDSFESQADFGLFKIHLKAGSNVGP